MKSKKRQMPSTSMPGPTSIGQWDEWYRINVPGIIRNLVKGDRESVPEGDIPSTVESRCGTWNNWEKHNLSETIINRITFESESKGVKETNMFLKLDLSPIPDGWSNKAPSW